jgi:hypothetical protein
MRSRSYRSMALAIALAAVLTAGTVAAQQANPAHTHIGHVRGAFGMAPDGQGLLPTAIAEARIAAQHAELAGRDPANLDAMKLHAGHVLHALDPSVVEQGPGQGFGVKRAGEAIATHIGLAAGSEGASANVATHAAHVAASARTVAQRADEAVAVATRIQAAGSAAEAAPLVEQLKDLTQQIVAGRDADGDGRITWEEGEGGLEQVEQHMNLMAQGEGMD